MFKIKVGDSFKIDYGPKNSNNKVIHIRALVDDEYYVFRWWSKRRQRWIYDIETIDALRFIDKENALHHR
jgi:hypothetical protein